MKLRDIVVDCDKSSEGVKDDVRVNVAVGDKVRDVLELCESSKVMVEESEILEEEVCVLDSDSE